MATSIGTSLGRALLAWLDEDEAATRRLEMGVRSIAAPLRDRSGQVVAAVNLSTHASRTRKQQLQQRFAVELLHTADDTEQALANRPD